MHLVSFFTSLKECYVKEKSIVKAGRRNMSFVFFKDEELPAVGNNPGDGSGELEI